MGKKLYINAWKASKATLQINNATDNRNKAINGFANYQLTDTGLNRVSYTLASAMGFQRGSETSWYQLFIPPMANEVIKVRISDYKSTRTEWPPMEDCLPNRRYSVVIFNKKSMHIQKESNIKYVDWVRYDVEGVPVYEIMIYCGILPLVWAYLHKVFSNLYNGEHPESNSIREYFRLKSNDRYETANDTIAK